MLCGFLASVHGLSSAAAEDWPHWQGPDRNGIARERLPENFDAETVLWRAPVGTGFASVAVSGGRVFTAGHDGAKDGGRETLWCLDSTTGKVIWSDSHEAALLPNLHEGGPAATPAVDGDRVYSLSKDGQVRCHETATGRLLWKRDVLKDSGLSAPPEWGFAGSPLVLGDRVIIEAGATFALDKATGEIGWRSQPFRPAYGSPVIVPHQGSPRLAVLKTDGLVVLDSDHGGTLAFTRWETPFETNATTPIVHGASLFVSTGYDRGCALFQFDGMALTKRYEHQLMCNHMNNSVLMDGHLYGFDGTAHRGRPTEFVCLEIESGRERWRVSPDEGLGCGSLIGTADGKLIVLTEKGELLIAQASPEGFEPVSRAQVLGGRCWTSPVLSGGRVFCRNARGDLVAVSGE
jgi:outer membrane protein assembly factor BamB